MNSGQVTVIPVLARYQRIVELIESQGLEHVHAPHIKHLEDKLREMRLKGRDGISRDIYVTARGKRLVEVRAPLYSISSPIRKSKPHRIIAVEGLIALIKQ